MQHKFLTQTFLCLLLTAALAASACVPAGPGATTPAAPFVTNLTPREATDIIQKNRANPGFIIMDVRTPAEFAAGHLENALLIDVSDPTFESAAGKLDRNVTYLVYCRTGNRSRTALAILSQLGFKYIYHLEAGITAWESAGYPTVK